MVILGFDPGIATVGFGVINANGAKLEYVRCGVITTKADTRLALRLSTIFYDAGDLIDTFKPDAIAVEELFFNTNITTGISVAHGRAALILAGEQRGVAMYEYTPLQVKQAVTGYGRAEKPQVIDMVKWLLTLETPPKPDDAADALAIAICHARNAASLMQGLGGSNCSTI